MVQINLHEAAISTPTLYFYKIKSRRSTAYSEKWAHEIVLKEVGSFASYDDTGFCIHSYEVTSLS